MLDRQLFAARNAAVRSLPLLLGALLVAGVPPLAYSQTVDRLIERVRGGQVPEQQLPRIIEVICQRGEEAELAFVFDSLVGDAQWSHEARMAGWNGLLSAAQVRRTAPTGNRSEVLRFLSSDAAPPHPPEEIAAAIRLAGLWQLNEAIDPLASLAADRSADSILLQAVVEALANIDSAAARDALREIAVSEHAARIRTMAVAELVRANDRQTVANLLGHLQNLDDQDLRTVLTAAVENPRAADAVAQQLGEHHRDDELPALALRIRRQMLAAGQSHAALDGLLIDLAGIQRRRPLDESEMAEFVKRVREKGDPQHGESVFRLPYLNCFQCHALHGAGGELGPDLSAIGSTSPIDFLATAILDPDRDIKELYQTQRILTLDGHFLSGIVVSEDDVSLRLRMADGRVVELPQDEIDDRAPGRSLMPAGLADELTDQQFVDLVAFLSQLGQPGPFATNDQDRLLRWRVYVGEPIDRDQGLESIAAALNVLDLDGPEWQAFYATVDGRLPLDELRSLDQLQSPGQLLVLAAEVEVEIAGQLEIAIEGMAEVRIAFAEQEVRLNAAQRGHVDAATGRHRILVFQPLSDELLLKSSWLRVRLDRAPNSTIQFSPVGGP